MATLRILDGTGDTALEWHADDPVSLARVEAEFRRLVTREKRMAFARPAGADEATLVREFDPTATEILVTRPLVGG